MVCRKLWMQLGQESSLDLWSWGLPAQPAGFVLLMALLPLPLSTAALGQCTALQWVQQIRLIPFTGSAE